MEHSPDRWFALAGALSGDETRIRYRTLCTVCVRDGGLDLMRTAT